MRITLREITITQGQSIGEIGTTHALRLPDDPVPETNLSVATRGYYQGSECIIDAVLEDGYQICNTIGGGPAIFDAGENYVTDDADAAISMGIIRRVATKED